MSRRLALPVRLTHCRCISTVCRAASQLLKSADCSASIQTATLSESRDGIGRVVLLPNPLLQKHHSRTTPLMVSTGEDLVANTGLVGSSSAVNGFVTLRPRYLQPDYQPLSTSHPVFGQQQAVVRKHSTREPLSTAHPAFGTKRKPVSKQLFKGPVSVSGFFLAIDPNFALGTRSTMNPNTQLTLRDQDGNSSRVRFRCQLEASQGLKLEAMVRFQVGWISPRVTFSKVPHVIYLGRGFDVSVPFLFHFTMVSVLDEHGCATGGALYFSGTPMLGLSIGYSRIERGRLIMDPSRELNPTHETTHHFIGHVHYRQAGFVLFKVLVWVVCALLCIPPVRRALTARLPNPLLWYSEKRLL